MVALVGHVGRGERVEAAGLAHRAAGELVQLLVGELAQPDPAERGRAGEARVALQGLERIGGEAREEAPPAGGGDTRRALGREEAIVGPRRVAARACAN